MSDVETLIRDPYALYARKILGLEALRAVGEPIGAAERGTAVHAALERHLAGEPASALLERIDQALAAAGASAPARRIERARLEAAATAFAAWAGARAGRRSLAEASGTRSHAAGWALHGRADRIDWDAAGRALIVDYKTGSSPTKAQARSGLAPQLTLLGAILAGEQGFEGAPAGLLPDQLGYWRFRLRAPGLEPVEYDAPVAEAAALAWASLAGLMRAYAAPDQPYLSKPRAQFARAIADYDQLARRAEWAEAEGDEG